MRIRASFTLDVPAEAMPALRELACVSDDDAVRGFVRAEASDHVVVYLTDNGVPVTVVRGVSSYAAP